MKFLKLGILLLAVGASSGVYADEFSFGSSSAPGMSRDTADSATIAPERRHRRRRGIWQCYAENNRGVIFGARGWSRHDTQRRAVRACRMRSRNPWSCHSLGCRIGF